MGAVLANSGRQKADPSPPFPHRTRDWVRDDRVPVRGTDDGARLKSKAAATKALRQKAAGKTGRGGEGVGERPHL